MGIKYKVYILSQALSCLSDRFQDTDLPSILFLVPKLPFDSNHLSLTARLIHCRQLHDQRRLESPCYSKRNSMSDTEKHIVQLMLNAINAMHAVQHRKRAMKADAYWRVQEKPFTC